MDEFKMYTLLEMIYVNHFKNKGVLERMLFPLDWYQIKNYQLKIEVLRESLNNEILIVDTDRYRQTKMW